MDASHLAKIFQGKRHIASGSIIDFVKLCKLNEKEAEYFETLVHFNKAKNEKEVKIAYEHLLSLKDIKKYKIEKDKYEFYQKWYYSAILTLPHFYHFDGDYTKLAEKLSPAISKSEAKKAVKLLNDLKLIEEDDDGSIVLTNKFVTSGDSSRAIMVKSYQEETIKLAAESLYRHEKDIRDISTVTVTIDDNDMDEIHEMISHFRSSLLKFAKKTDKPNSVYQFNIQFFPLTDSDDNKS